MLKSRHFVANFVEVFSQRFNLIKTILKSLENDLLLDRDSLSASFVGSGLKGHLLILGELGFLNGG